MNFPIKARPVFAITLVVAAAIGVPPVHAGRGALELSLDRSAVAALIDASLPQPQEYRLAGVGSVSVVLGPVRAVTLLPGRVRVELRIGLAEVDWSGSLGVELVPEVRPDSGAIQLVVKDVELGEALPLRGLDLAALIDPIELPRSFGGSVEVAPGRLTDLTLFVQSAVVDAERLRIELSLLTRPEQPERPGIQKNSP